MPLVATVVPQISNIRITKNGEPIPASEIPEKVFQRIFIAGLNVNSADRQEYMVLIDEANNRYVVEFRVSAETLREFSKTLLIALTRQLSNAD